MPTGRPSTLVCRTFLASCSEEALRRGQGDRCPSQDHAGVRGMQGAQLHHAQDRRNDPTGSSSRSSARATGSTRCTARPADKRAPLVRPKCRPTTNAAPLVRPKCGPRQTPPAGPAQVPAPTNAAPLVGPSAGPRQTPPRWSGPGPPRPADRFAQAGGRFAGCRLIRPTRTRLPPSTPYLVGRRDPRVRPGDRRNRPGLHRSEPPGARPPRRDRAADVPDRAGRGGDAGDGRRPGLGLDFARWCTATSGSATSDRYAPVTG